MGLAHPLGGVRSILLLVAVAGPIGCSKEVRVDAKLEPAHENLELPHLG